MNIQETKEWIKANKYWGMTKHLKEATGLSQPTIDNLLQLDQSTTKNTKVVLEAAIKLINGMNNYPEIDKFKK